MVLNVVVWRGKSSVNTMAAKPDAQAIEATLKELGLYDAAVHAEAQLLRQQAAAKKQESDAAKQQQQLQQEEAVAVAVEADVNVTEE